MANKYSYRFAPKAFSDLDATLAYIEQELFNPKAAEDLAVELFKKIDHIRLFPLSGRALSNEFISDQTLRKFFVGKYIVFYKPDKETKTIIIVRIVYGGRNIDEILKTI